MQIALHFHSACAVDYSFVLFFHNGYNVQASVQIHKMMCLLCCIYPDMSVDFELFLGLQGMMMISLSAISVRRYTVFIAVTDVEFCYGMDFTIPSLPSHRC